MERLQATKKPTSTILPVEREQIVRGSFSSQLDPAEDPLDLKQSMWQKQTPSTAALCDLCSAFMGYLFLTPRLRSEAERARQRKPVTRPRKLTCHHLKVSSERALFSLVISGWMD